MSEPKNKFSMQRNQKLFILLTFVGMAILYFALDNKLSLYLVNQEKSPTHLHETSGLQKLSEYSVFVPSPVERSALNRIPELWPQSYDMQNPLMASALPTFYKILYSSRGKDVLGLGAIDMALVRKWSIDANAANIESLRRALLLKPTQILNEDFSQKEIDKLVKEKQSFEWLMSRASEFGKGCSLINLERAFRLTQAWPLDFDKNAASYFKKCAGENDLMTLWVQIRAQLFGGKGYDSSSKEQRAKVDSISFALSQIEQEAEGFDSFLASKLLQLAFLKSTHSSGGASSSSTNSSK